MTTTAPPTSSPPIWWKVHDTVVGFLSGFGVGAVAGLFLNTQIGDNVVVLIAAAIGAAIGVYVLIRNHQGSARFLNAVVVVSWVLLILSTLFLALLIWAVATFE